MKFRNIASKVYLRREHAEVSGRRAAAEVLATGGFNVRSVLGNSDNLNQRQLHRNGGWNENGVHWVIGHPLPHHGMVQNHCYVMGLKMLGWSQPT